MPASAAGPPAIHFGDVLSSDAVRALVQLPEVRDALLPFLPDSYQTSTELSSTLDAAMSPELSAAARRFTSAAHSSNINSIFATFGLSPADGAGALQRGDNVRALLDAMAAQHPGVAVDDDAGAASATGGGGGGGTEGTKGESDDDMYDD
jgi:hypothetical protein